MPIKLGVSINDGVNSKKKRWICNKIECGWPNIPIWKCELKMEKDCGLSECKLQTLTTTKKKCCL